MGQKMEAVTGFIYLGFKITADGDCRHGMKRLWLLGRKATTNLDSILKSRDITLPTKVHLDKAMVFSVVMYGCESWTIRKTECQRIDAFELWCWRRLLRDPWTARRSNQSILKEINPEYSWKDWCWSWSSNTLATWYEEPTHCDPMDCRKPGLSVHHQLPEFTQTHVHWVHDAIPSFYPLSSHSPPAFNLSQHQGLFQWARSSHQVAKVLELQLQHQSFQWIFRTEFL